MIHEKGLCKVLSAAYKGGGYSVIPVRRQVETVARSWRRNEIILNGATWAVRCLTEDLPKEAAVQIVKDVGYMPMEPVSVQKSQPNQTMLEDVADIRESQLEELPGRIVRHGEDPRDFPGPLAVVPDNNRRGLCLRHGAAEADRLQGSIAGVPDYAAWQHGYVLMGRRDGISGAGAGSPGRTRKRSST